MNMSEKGKYIAKKWKQLSENVKQQFREKATFLKRLYAKELSLYQSTEEYRTYQLALESV